MSMEITNNYRNYAANYADTAKKTDSKAQVKENISTNSKDKVQAYYEQLCKKFPQIKINATGGIVSGSKNIIVLNLSNDCLKKMASDPDFAKKIESDIAGIPKAHEQMFAKAKSDGIEIQGFAVRINADGSMQCSCSGSTRTSGTTQKTSGKKDKQKELLEESFEKWVQVKKQQQERLNEKVAKQERNRLSKNRETIIDRIAHTVIPSVTSFSDTRAGILKEVAAEKGQYDYSDVVNACGLSYARLYSAIEERYKNENEQYYKADGTFLTMEEEIDWLNMQYEQEVKWQKSCAKIAAEGQVFTGRIPKVPVKEIEELEDSLYQAKDGYMKLHQENKQSGKPSVLQSYMFGSKQMYEILNRLGNLQRSVK